MGGPTAFSRVSGEIVHDSFSIVSFFTGLLAVVPAGLLWAVEASGPRARGEAAAVFVVWGLTVLVFVSRFAQLGIAGDTDGGLFSSSAGPWSGTFLAATRLLVLWAAWLAPFVLWVVLRDDAAPPTGVAGFPVAALVPRVPFLLALWSALGVVLGFAFVAVSAAASGFGDLFSPGLWGTLFGGRLGELFVVAAGTFGPPAAVFLVVVPVFAAIAPENGKLALTFLVPFLLYAVGMALTLQGKLSGAFSAARLAEEPEEGVAAAPTETDAAPIAASAAPAAAPPLGDPKSLHAVWKSRLAGGDADGAVAAARELIPAGLAKGEPRLASEAYRRHLDRLPELGLDRTALDLVADQLLRDGDVAAAAWTFSQALDAQVDDPKAFKGLLRVAEHYAEKSKLPLEAVRIYRYLLERAPASPFAQHARDLLADAERKAARPAAPQG